MTISSEILLQGQAVRDASLKLANLSTTQKNQALQELANAVRDQASAILEANRLDCEKMLQEASTGKNTEVLYQRLVLNCMKVEQMAQNLEAVSLLADPVGKIQLATRLDEGLDLYRVCCPIGVLLVIFEARPEVVIQISALAIKSGNAVLLKGGKEAFHSNQVLAQLVQQTLQDLSDFPEDSVTLLNHREEVSSWLQMDAFVDLVIPRGGPELVHFIKKNSRIPVLAHADGICHIFLNEDADLSKSLEVIVDSKTNYPSACNALETLLVHQDFNDNSLVQILMKLHEQKVALRVCSRTQERLREISSMVTEAATESDWKAEYGDLILSVKTVYSLEEAISHINHYGSHHTDAILTENAAQAEQFMAQVDAANVFWNASTRFADGFRYGFGAEVGISTSRTHARGPVGLEGLMIYKYKLYGQGQGVQRYAPPGKSYLHQPLPLNY